MGSRAKAPFPYELCGGTGHLRTEPGLLQERGQNRLSVDWRPDSWRWRGCWRRWAGACGSAGPRKRGAGALTAAPQGLGRPRLSLRPGPVSSSPLVARRADVLRTCAHPCSGNHPEL